MHASISHFAGDPDELARRYDAMVAEIPAAIMKLHLCLRAPDGLVVVDTCPTREAFESFHGGGAYRSLRERHGLPDPDRLDDFPVHLAFADGAVVASTAV